MRRLMVAAVLAAAAPGFAFAQAQSGSGLANPGAGRGRVVGEASGAQRLLIQSCSADVRAYCSTVQPGGGRMSACMRANWSKVSQPCKSAAAAMRNASAAGR